MAHIKTRFAKRSLAPLICTWCWFRDPAGVFVQHSSGGKLHIHPSPDDPTAVCGKDWRKRPGVKGYFTISPPQWVRVK